MTFNTEYSGTLFKVQLNVEVTAVLSFFMEHQGVPYPTTHHTEMTITASGSEALGQGVETTISFPSRRIPVIGGVQTVIAMRTWRPESGRLRIFVFDPAIERPLPSTSFLHTHTHTHRRTTSVSGIFQRGSLPITPTGIVSH